MIAHLGQAKLTYCYVDLCSLM